MHAVYTSCIVYILPYMFIGCNLHYIIAYMHIIEIIKISKKKSTKSRDWWMEALADKAHKQGEHISQ